MTWIKRNLFFVIGSAVAVLLLGLAGFFAYSKWNLNNEAWTNLSADYEKLKDLNNRDPHPGSGQVDNVKLAQQQRDQLTNVILKAENFFKPIPRIPDLPKINDQEFSAALARTVEQLQRAATNASITLPSGYTDYYFSFQAQKSKITFAAGSPERLAVQLGEVKTIAELLLQSKINAIDGIRRERVSADDSYGPLSDYLIEKTATNQLASLDNRQALITPYEVTFRSFSAELANVLSAFAASPHGFVVKSVNVEPAPAAAASDVPAIAAAPQPQLVYQNYAAQQQGANNEEAAARASAAQAFQRRYGRGGGGGGGLGGIAPRGLESAPQPQAYTVPAVGQPLPGAPAKTGPQMVLDEKLLKVTLSLAVVKLVPITAPGQAPAPAPEPAAQTDATQTATPTQ
jgi:hypothetical protein